MYCKRFTSGILFKLVRMILQKAPPKFMRGQGGTMSNRALRALYVLTIVLALCALAFVVIVSATSGSYMEKTYALPRNADYSRQFEDGRVQLISYGILASSAHNMQSWRVELEEEQSFLLYADAEKRLAADADGRELMISQGTFLQNIKLAAAEKGMGLEIELFPDGQPDEENFDESLKQLPVARVVITESQANTESGAAEGFDYIARATANRSPYIAAPDAEQIEKLEGLSGEGFEIAVLNSPADIERIGNYAVRGKAFEYANDTVVGQLAKITRLNEYQKNQKPFGLSAEGEGLKGINLSLAESASTLIPALNSREATTKRQVKNSRKLAAATQAYLLLTTPGSAREQQVEAGMIYQQIVLLCHSMGLAVQPVSQPLASFDGSVRALKAEFYADYVPSGGQAQMLVRVGVPQKAFPGGVRQSALSIVSGESSDPA